MSLPRGNGNGLLVKVDECLASETAAFIADHSIRKVCPGCKHRGSGVDGGIVHEDIPGPPQLDYCRRDVPRDVP